MSRLKPLLQHGVSHRATFAVLLMMLVDVANHLITDLHGVAKPLQLVFLACMAHTRGLANSHRGVASRKAGRLEAP